MLFRSETNSTISPNLVSVEFKIDLDVSLTSGLKFLTTTNNLEPGTTPGNEYQLNIITLIGTQTQLLTKANPVTDQGRLDFNHSVKLILQDMLNLQGLFQMSFINVHQKMSKGLIGTGNH